MNIRNYNFEVVRVYAEAQYFEGLSGIKNAYNDESRFGIINSMMICKALGEDDAARDMMQTYELCKEAGRKLFRLL